MDYLPCCGCNLHDAKNRDCVELALDKIKEHYFYFRRKAERNHEQLENLRERNRKLEETVKLLQAEQADSAAKPSNNKVKRRKLNNTGKQPDNIEFVYDKVAREETSPMATSDLNVALCSEQLLDSSSQSCISTQNETIAETESLGEASPRKLGAQHANWLKLRTKKRSKLELDEEAATNLDRTDYCKNKDSAVVTDNKAEISLSKSNTSTIFDLIQMKNEKKVNLSLGKRNVNKMHQSRLPFEKRNEKSDEVIVDSPQMANRQLKGSRSLMVRSGKRDDSNSSSNKNNNSNNNTACSSTETNPSFNNSHYLFDFNKTTMSPIGKKRAMSAITNDVALQSLQIPLTNKTSNSSSCILLSPATQEIVFVDDDDDEDDDKVDTDIEAETSDHSKYIKTMDLMADVMKSNSDSLTNLKRLESIGIRKQQRRAASCKENTPEDADADAAVHIKNEKFNKFHFNDNDSTFIDDAMLAQHNIPTNPQTSTNTKDKLIDLKNPLDEINNLADAVKVSIVKREAASNTPKCKLSFKDRFEFDCDDCEKYLNLVGDRMTDKEIYERLEKCGHRNLHDMLMQQTPDGFWNPLLLSFAEDDPRNVVHIDTRFIGKKRKS